MAKSQKPSLFTSHHHWYNSIIKSLPSSNHSSKILYTYQKVVNGFSASLTPSQALKLKDIPGVLSVTLDQIQKIQTTHSYQFLGLSSNSGIWPDSNWGEDIIIGVVDTGIWPEHPSFVDTGFSPVPPTWKGICEWWDDFPASSCNRKLIGARAFLRGYYMNSGLDKSQMNVSVETASPRDTDGHGTHVASTAAGVAVPNASLFGYAKGTAIGIAPKARIAAYKVCTADGCQQSDMLAGIDQAVYDGVHIISMSISGGTDEYYLDNTAIASYGATQFGVLVSVAAANFGPDPSTVNHLAPWILTVGASSINREFPADVVLGNSRKFMGTSLYAGDPLPSNQYQVAYAGDYMNPFCKFGNFRNPNQLAGKIIVCEGNKSISTYETVEAVIDVNGVGIIMINTVASWDELQSEPFPRPGVRVTYNDGNQIKQYIRSSQIPTATILFGGTIIGTVAPKVASFSSRGPNPLTPQILKPDVIAPGLNILAAWTQAAGPWGDVDPRRVEFNIISGTSMACPHVSGIAALLINIYPNWSPAAIKSAIMTTTYNLDNSGQSIKDLSTGTASTPFAHGAGHVNPNRALNPGLVYDMGEIDYIGFLCSIGYDCQQISILSRDQVDPDICDQAYAALGGQVKPGDLNLPSFSVVFDHQVETVKYRRIVTNVGSDVNAVYAVSWYAPPGTTISITPNRLVFSSRNRKQKYVVTFSSLSGAGVVPRFGWIEWNDGTHRVRSTISFTWSTATTASVASV
ncbi:hypothetical protein TIFTF001_002927 [Ficus carica]|uniref:Uncharacterized protein n=1 Tax=Ficus carica TaxID=3494 RepID=A0AA88CUW4_FICCA|nr:hypothetical protein TIFTF001_002927 [Ficus carica]